MRGWYALSRAHPVVRRAAVVEGMLPVRELARHRRAEDELRRADLDGIPKAPARLAAAQVRGDQAPDRLPVGLEEQADHVLDLGRRQRRVVRLLRSEEHTAELQSR